MRVRAVHLSHPVPLSSAADLRGRGAGTGPGGHGLVSSRRFVAWPDPRILTAVRKITERLAFLV